LKHHIVFDERGQTERPGLAEGRGIECRCTKHTECEKNDESMFHRGLPRDVLQGVYLVVLLVVLLAALRSVLNDAVLEFSARGLLIKLILLSFIEKALVFLALCVQNLRWT
jgi:hypothetical protein